MGNTSGRQPTSDDMILVLSHLTSLRIRAKWTTLTAERFSRLADIALTLNSSDRWVNIGKRVRMAFFKFFKLLYRGTSKCLSKT